MDFQMKGSNHTLHYCFTPLVGAIVDSSEALLYAGLCGKTSPTTIALYKQFGNTFWHEPQMASTTLAQLMHVESTIDPWDLNSYLHVIKWFKLNGVHHLFWRDCPSMEPSLFLTPEWLHYWHEMFWYHNTKWCIWMVGAAEIDLMYNTTL